MVMVNTLPTKLLYGYPKTFTFKNSRWRISCRYPLCQIPDRDIIAAFVNTCSAMFPNFKGQLVFFMKKSIIFSVRPNLMGRCKGLRQVLHIRKAIKRHGWLSLLTSPRKTDAKRLQPYQPLSIIQNQFFYFCWHLFQSVIIMSSKIGHKGQPII